MQKRQKKKNVQFEKIEKRVLRSFYENFTTKSLFWFWDHRNGFSKYPLSASSGERKKRKRVERRCSRSSFNRSRIPNEIKIPRRTFEGYKPGRNPKSDSARSGVRSYTRGTTADSSENDLENESKKRRGEKRKEENKIRETLQFEIVIPDWYNIFAH